MALDANHSPGQGGHVSDHNAIDTALGQRLIAVDHGSTAGTARPTSTLPVKWFGTVAPTNGITNDEWYDRTNEILKRYDGTTWQAVGKGTYPARSAGTAATAAAVPFVNAGDFTGYDATGATSSTAAVNAAITAALANGTRRVMIPGTALIDGTGLLAPDSGKFVTIAGFGRKRTSRLLLATGATTLVTNGADNGGAYDANDYSGPDGLTLENLRLEVQSPTTLLDNGWGSYTPGTYAVRDWRGGNVTFRNVFVDGFDFPFWGIQSDINSWYQVEINHAHSGIYLGPRSDQFESTDRIAFNYCDRCFDVDSTIQFSLRDALIYGCGVPMTATTIGDLVLSGGSATVTSATANFTAADKGRTLTAAGIPDQSVIVTVTNSTTVVLNQTATASGTVSATAWRSGGTSPVRIRAAYPRGTHRAALLDCHFETVTKPDGGLAVYESFVSIATSGSEAAQTVAVNIERPSIQTASITAGHHMQYLAKIDNAEAVVISDPGGVGWQYLDGLVLLTGATASGQHKIVSKAPVSTTVGASHRKALQVIDASTASPPPRVLREVYGNTRSGGLPGAFVGWMIDETTLFRIITVPTTKEAFVQVLDLGGTVMFQMQLGAGGSAGSRYANFSTPGGGVLLVGASGDKVGFYGSAGVVKPAALPADATDLASAITLLNYIKNSVIKGVGLAS